MRLTGKPTAESLALTARVLPLWRPFLEAFIREVQEFGFDIGEGVDQFVLSTRGTTQDGRSLVVTLRLDVTDNS